MRKATLLLFCSVLTVFVFQAQSQKKTTKQTVKKDFVSTEGGFSINFPVKPVKKTKPMSAAFGQTISTWFEATTGNALYNLVYVDFPTAITDEYEKNTRFDAMKSYIISNNSYNLVNENVVYYEGYIGREFVVESPKLTITMRGFIIEQRLFQMIVVTIGRLSKLTPKVKAATQKRIGNFVNSFKVTNLPTPKTVATELPDDFGISINDGLLKSEFFGLTYQIPQDWTVLTDEQVRLIKDLLPAFANQNSDYEDKQLENSLKNTEILLFALDKPFESGETESMLIVSAERVSFPNFLPSSVISSYVANLEPTEKVVKKTTNTKINGVDFAWVETFDSANKTGQRLYVANRKGIAFEILFTFKNQTQLQTLVKSLETIKFE
jgi:hypothetical protein